MAKKILVYSGKGGVGKTTTTSTVASILADSKHRVLMVDLDANNTLTAHKMGSLAGIKTIREALNGDVPLTDVIYSIKPSLWLIPALKTLIRIDKDHTDNPDQFFILKDALERVEGSFDYIVMDAPGATNLLTKAAVVAADIVIIPTRLEQFDVSAIEDVFDEINRCARQRQGIPLEKTVILPTFYESGNAVHAGFQTALNQKYGQFVTSSIVHKARAISWANSSADSALDRKSRAYEEYISAVREILPEAGL